MRKKNKILCCLIHEKMESHEKISSFFFDVVHSKLDVWRQHVPNVEF